MNPPTVARGVTSLVFDAVDHTSRIVEGMHANIAAAPPPFGKGTDQRTRGVTGLVYTSIRIVNQVARTVTDLVLDLSSRGSQSHAPERESDSFRSVLNGVLGDHLFDSGNPLAIPTSFRRRGGSLPLDREGLAAAVPEATGKILLLVHGLCMSDRSWRRRGHDHGAALERELGYTAVYLRYNSGRHVSENGRELAALLETLLASWPVAVEELTIVAHSMGGLVARSAYHYAVEAGRRWPEQLSRLVFLGTPHHGAPLERGGNWLQSMASVSPYTAPLSRLGMLRSAGITDLRFGNVTDEDWRDCDRFARGADGRVCVPLPARIDCHAIAATLGGADHFLGDGLVPVASALGRHSEARRCLSFAESRQWVGVRMNHLELLDRPEVYAKLGEWLAIRRTSSPR